MVSSSLELKVCTHEAFTRASDSPLLSRNPLLSNCELSRSLKFGSYGTW